MTQAFNLAQLANNLNTSGQLDATDGLNGLIANANLASSGTASSSTYLRGDRTWASLQVVQFSYSTEVIIGSSGTWVNSGLTGSITPASASSRILILLSMQYRLVIAAADNGFGFRVLRNGTVAINNIIGSNYYEVGYNSRDIFNGDSSLSGRATYNFVDSPGSTSAVTYNAQGIIRNSTGGNNGSMQDDGYFTSYMTLMEIAP